MSGKLNGCAGGSALSVLFAITLLSLLLYVPTSATAQNSILAESYNFYKVPKSENTINSAISGMMGNCAHCAQVERIPKQKDLISQLAINDCHLNKNLVELSAELAEAIEEIHEAQESLSMQKLRENEPKGCDSRTLAYRIYVAVQIIKKLP